MIRKILLSTVALVAVSGTALAADLPSRSAPPVYVPPPPIFNWTGVYIGGQLGYEWGTANYNAFTTATGATVGTLGTTPSGVTGGAHLGYNLQFTQFVVGLEGDLNGSSYHQNTAFAPIAGATVSDRQDIDGSIRGRVGVAWDRALFYATGGVAFAPIHNSFTVGGVTDTSDPTRVGWTVGGGIEYAIDNNWSIRGEYRYTDYGHITTVLTNTTAGVLSVRDHETDNRVQAGFSYKFGAPVAPAPVVAKY